MTEQLLSHLADFRERCEEAEYTDTGDAWAMIDRLEDALRQASGRREVSDATLTEEQIDKAEQLLSYLGQHAEQLTHGPEVVHREWWMGSAANLLRDLLPEWSAFKEA